METTRFWLLLAGVNGLMAVTAGAFGAHAVSDPQVKDWLRTGAQYQLVHGVAGLACFGFMRMAVVPAAWAGWLFGFGGLVFGGSLYLMAITGARMLGAVTPIGGLLMILGWTAVIWGVFAGSFATGA
jgi:uncharacterized membrane protein YgdD (TMEM256/DUF423 family)